MSEVRDVIALPTKQQIVVKEGRNFTMGGRLIAGSGGRFRIKSEDITFNYEDFRLYFKDASTEVWIPNNQEKYNEKGELVLEPLENEITIANGELLVDTTSINRVYGKKIIPNIQSSEVMTVLRYFMTKKKYFLECMIESVFTSI